MAVAFVFQRIINSFDLIGATSLVETLAHDRSDCSETEADYHATIEEERPAGMDELIDLELDFMKEELVQDGFPGESFLP